MATYLNYPFDPELFLLNWQNEPDPTLTALYDSGAVQANATIQGLIANGGDFYTIPYYSVLTHGQIAERHRLWPRGGMGGEPVRARLQLRC